jgi:nucleoside-diphosphate-sugar epimerase
MKRVLVTGGSGFIGTNLLRRLIERGFEVANLDVRPPQDDRQAVLWREADLMDPASISRVLSGFRPDAVVHLAARTDLDEKTSLAGYSANIDGVRNLVEAIRGCGSVRRALFTSSQLVCRVGHVPASDTEYLPNTLYGESKVMTEKIVRETGGGGVPCWCIVRPTTVWGPWFSAHYQRFVGLVRAGRYFHVGSRPLRKSYGYVGNFCHQVEGLLSAPPEDVHGKTLYLADYEPVAIQAWAEEFRKAFGAPPIRRYPAWLARAAAAAGDLLVLAGWRAFPFTSFRLNNILTEYVFDLSETRRIVPELPFTMAQGVGETAEWIRTREGGGK